MYAWGYAVHLIIGSLNFSRVLDGCLDIISFHGAPKMYSNQQFLSELDKSLRYFEKLSKLMDADNEMFAWIVFSQFGGYLFLGCIIAYTPLQYWTVVPKLSLLMYIFIFVTWIIILCRLFPGMGSVYDKSIVFIESWTAGMAYSQEDLFLTEVTSNKKYFKLLKFRLASCVPFGVKCGDFFIIRKSTMLTFFSVISTYLLIMLQFDF